MVPALVSLISVFPVFNSKDKHDMSCSVNFINNAVTADPESFSPPRSYVSHTISHSLRDVQIKWTSSCAASIDLRNTSERVTSLHREAQERLEKASHGHNLGTIIDLEELTHGSDRA